MAEGKKSFVLYSDQKELFEHLSDEQAGKLIKHILRYVNDENPTCDDAVVNLAFIAIKSSLKRDLEKWERQIKQRKEAGKKSAESRKRNSTTVNERTRNSTDNVSVSVNVNDIPKGIDIRKQEFATRVKSFESKYPIETLREFYLYWSEHSDNGKKMRYEMQKVFNIERRLITWVKNQDKFDTPKQQGYTDERTENILRQIANIPKP
jgi:hypothetical protein